VSSTFRLPDLASSAAWSALIAAIAGALLGVAIVSKPLFAFALVAGVTGFIVVLAAFAYPARVFVGFVLLVALVPTYASQTIGPFLVVPGAALGWVLAAAFAWRNLLSEGRILKPNVVDYTAGAFVLLMAVSVSFSERAEATDFLRLMFLWIGPYLAARLLLRETDRPATVVAAAFALATLIIAPIAFFESLGAANPFYNLNFNSTEFAVWGSSVQRFGQIRSVTSFGHPIAFSMFITASALLSTAMATSSKRPAMRNAWYAMAAIAVAVQSLALSRTGWLMLALGIVLIAAITVRGKLRRRLVMVLTITGAVVLLTSIVMPTGIQVLPGFSPSNEANDSFQASGTYREALLSRAIEPGVLNLWGNPVNRVTPAVEGGTATDNAYIILADTWGLIPSFALILMGLSLLWVIGKAYMRRLTDLSGPPVAAFAALAALFFVAFITQQQLMIWLLVGTAAVTAERLGSTPPRPEPDEVES
jgi:hypothetical protein